MSPHCTSIIVFGVEYYYDSSGIVTLYEPGGLHKKISKDPLRISNFNRSQSEWSEWVTDQKNNDFKAEKFDFEKHNWNHFTREAALFFGLGPFFLI